MDDGGAAGRDFTAETIMLGNICLAGYRASGTKRRSAVEAYRSPRSGKE